MWDSIKLWNLSLHWCFLILFIRHVLPTPWLSIQFTPYLIDGKLIQIILGLILLLYCVAGKTWVKNTFHFTFWYKIFAWVRFRFYKSSFFIPSFQNQDSSSYYLEEATAKIPKFCKLASLDVYFSTYKSQDRATNCQWINQPKFIDCPSDAFFEFRNSP